MQLMNILLFNVWKPSHDCKSCRNASDLKSQWKQLEEFKWLTYYAILGDTYCFSCVSFGGESTNNASKLRCLFREPLTDSITAIRRLKNHALKSPVCYFTTHTGCSLHGKLSQFHSKHGALQRQEMHRVNFLAISFEFIVCLIVVVRLIEVTRPLTKQLQSVDTDFNESIEKVTLLLSMLKRIRREIDKFCDVRSAEAVELSGKVGARN